MQHRCHRPSIDCGLSRRFDAGVWIRWAFLAATAAGWIGGTAPEATAADNWASKMFGGTEHDFRTVARGTQCEHGFEIKNPYNETVHIAAVRSSCGCTTPTIDTDQLTTGQTATLLAKFNTTTHIGTKAATITVVFDAPTYAEVRLKVRGHIRTDITFDPPELDFGQFEAGSERQQRVTITRNGNPNWQISDVRSHCEHLRVRLSPPTRSGNSTRYQMDVTLAPTAPVGDLRNRLTLVSNDRNFPTTEMSVAGRIRPALEISPAAVGLGQLSADGETSRRLIIRGKSPFTILGVQTDDERLKFDLPDGKKKLHVVTMRYTGDGGDRPIETDIEVVSDLPGETTAVAKVTGAITR